MTIKFRIAKWAFSLVLMFCFHGFISAGGVDTCLINDDCQTSIFMGNIIADQTFVCMQGCNEYSAPDPIVSGCQMGDYPTVWYSLTVDPASTIINIEVRSDDFDSPAISLFKGGCGNLEQVYMSNGNLACIIGAQGVAKGIGTYVTGGTTYYIAVSSVLSIGGEFEICVSTISNGSICVLNRGIEVVSRSDGGPLEGPFNPAEKLRICLDVNEFTASNNGCQWFQGIVPVFGNGWDPSSFDPIGEPGNATVNDSVIGIPGNGIYGVTIWDWFTGVNYHYDNPRLKIGDFDNNGRIELCNSAYETECQQTESVTGGCCGPCWDSIPGDILPGGWFAYGINGTCSIAGPPIGVDWGDGNTCGGGMGPWSFCFDIVTRDTPDCMGDSTRTDLTLGFYTFADGEIGSWIGNASVCAFDQPIKLSLKAQCGRITTDDPEYLPTINSEDIFTYQIDDRGVAFWEWNISPYWAMPYVTNTAENGFIIQNQAYNPTGEPVDITIIFIGHEIGSEDVTVRKVFFRVNPWTTGNTSVYDDVSLNVFPNPTENTTVIDWPASIGTIKHLTIYNSQGILVREITGFQKASQHYELDLRNYGKGLYFVNLVTDRKIYTAKIIKG